MYICNERILGPLVYANHACGSEDLSVAYMKVMHCWQKMLLMIGAVITVGHYGASKSKSRLALRTLPSVMSMYATCE